MLGRDPRQSAGGRATPHLGAHTHTHTHTHGLEHSGRLRPPGTPQRGAGQRAPTHPPCSAMGAVVESGEGRSWDPEGLL